MAMLGTAKFTTMKSVTIAKINKNYETKRSVSTTTAYKLQNLIVPYKDISVKQGAIDCYPTSSRFLKATYAPPLEATWSNFFRRLWYGDYLNVQLKQVARNPPASGKELMELFEKHGKLRLNYGNIAMEGSRFETGFHCPVLTDLIQTPGGKTLGLLYDCEGKPNVSQAEQLIGFGDLKEIKSEDEIDPELRASLNLLAAMYRVVDLDEFVKKASIVNELSGIDAIDPEKSDPPPK